MTNTSYFLNDKSYLAITSDSSLVTVKQINNQINLLVSHYLVFIHFFEDRIISSQTFDVAFVQTEEFPCTRHKK